MILLSTAGSTSSNAGFLLHSKTRDNRRNTLQSLLYSALALIWLPPVKSFIIEVLILYLEFGSLLITKRLLCKFAISGFGPLPKGLSSTVLFNTYP